MNDKDTVVVPELLPCPFCGGSAATDVDRDEWDIARALCTVCGADGPYEDLADHASEAKAVAKAAERWNDRAAAPSTSVREEDVREAIRNPGRFLDFPGRSTRIDWQVAAVLAAFKPSTDKGGVE